MKFVVAIVLGILAGALAVSGLAQGYLAIQQIWEGQANQWGRGFAVVCILLVAGVSAYGAYDPSLVTSAFSLATSSTPVPLVGTPVNEEKQQETMLKSYEDDINTLVLHRGLRSSKQGDAVNDTAHAETLSIIPQLDNARKRNVLQFLRNAHLIGYDHFILYLNGVDLSHTDLSHMDLSGVNLNKANFSFANLTGTDFSGANIGDGNFTGANLCHAIFLGDELTNSNLTLTGATFPDCTKHN